MKKIPVDLHKVVMMFIDEFLKHRSQIEALEKRVKTFEEWATCRCEYPSPTHLGYCSDCGKIERNEP